MESVYGSVLSTSDEVLEVFAARRTEILRYLMAACLLNAAMLSGRPQPAIFDIARLYALCDACKGTASNLWRQQVYIHETRENFNRD